MSILARWRARLAIRKRLLARAHAAKNKALIARRKAQVAYAERVVDRHRNDDPATEISPRGVEFIKQFEGFRSHPYQDVAGVWTIGYGHTEGVGPNSQPLTEPQAEALLHAEINRKYAPPVTRLQVPLTQHQFDAVTSLVYNCGPGCIAAGTTVGDALRRRDLKRAADGFLLWDKAGGRRLPGLTRRREAERTMFLGRQG